MLGKIFSGGANELVKSVGGVIDNLHTSKEEKLEAKRKTGLCFVRDKQEYCKSFKDCSKQELNLVIQSLIEMGDFANTNLR